MAIGIGISTMWRRGGGSDWSSYWKRLNKVLFLWSGRFDGDNLLSDIDATVITLTGKDFATTYIPYTSTATFAVPDNATYEGADTDLMWFDSGGTPKTVAVKQLVNFDYERTIIRYANEDPYHITGIMILKSGELLTEAEIDRLHSDFSLWMYWAGIENDNGYLKDNRTIDDVPVVVSMEVPAYNSTKVVITFDLNLDEDNIPAVDNFDVTGSVTGVKTITDVAVLGAVVTLTVSVAFDDETVTVDYNQPLDDALRSALGGGKVATFTGQPVTNYLYGSELVTDGTFDVGTGWTKETPAWTVSGGVANCNGTDTLIYRSVITEVGETYKLMVTVICTSGDFIAFAGEYRDSRHISTGWQTTSNTFSVTGVAQATTTIVAVAAGGGGFVGSVDNISLRKVQI